MLRTETELFAVLDSQRVLGGGEVPGISTLKPDSLLASLGMAHDQAHVRTRGLNVPTHGAEFCRAYLGALSTAFPKSNSFVNGVKAKLSANRVIFEEEDQVRAARKQISRLRSDALGADPDTRHIPEVRLVFSNEPGDFLGVSYEVYRGPVWLTSDPATISIGTKKRTRIAYDQLRYVEGPMIRPR